MAYVPQKILVEDSVVTLPLTQKILGRLPGVPVTSIPDHRKEKTPQPISLAKRSLTLARAKGEALKPFPKIKDAINLGDYIFNPISNCHLECTYCILQSYLSNNPGMTIFPNLDFFIESIIRLTGSQAQRTFRIGTGELSDSLALDSLTELSGEWVPLFAKLPNAFLEFKTKTDSIENLLSLDHRGHTVVSWSLAPENIIQKEELKCADLQQRLKAAARVQNAGYPVGLHFDPMIYFEGWEKAYEELLTAVQKNLDPRRIAWISVGSLRFDKPLKKIAMERFGRSALFSEDFIAGPDGKMHYFKALRLQMYRWMWDRLCRWSEEIPRYLCMEAPWVWEKVTAEDPPSPETIENQLVARLRYLEKTQ